MGVPKFYRWISERYPCLSEVVKEYQIPEFDNLYLDMNGIIHNCSHPNDDDPHFRITEEKIFADIFHYIEVLFRMIQPRKVFFMAIDGVAPRAKMNQQRGRRFRSAKEAEQNEKKAKDRGEVLPKEDRFDSNCITPGTPFMTRLHQQLKYFVVNKISTDSLWRNTRVILSGHETPGEGEHKIMDFIRYEKAQPGYDPNTRHCLYGLDADLLMLGLCSHDPHFSLLREEVKFGGRKTQAAKRTPTPEEITFHLLHLSLLREYLDYEFQELRPLPFYNVENIIDDWVLMGFLVGNDFIPHLPNMHINKGALPELYAAYKTVLPSLGGYLNEGGTLNLPRFQRFMETLSQYELEKFDDIYSDAKWLEGKTARKNLNGRTEVEPTPGPGHVYEMLGGGLPEPGVNTGPIPSGRKSDLQQLMESTREFDSSDSESDPLDTSDSEARGNFYQMEFRQHKRDYYIHKLGYSQVNEETLREQAEGYVRAIQWNLHYYYNGCVSWSWFYPHHFSPWITDIRHFAGMKMEFELAAPFRPFEQLLAVLPAASKSLLPPCFQWLMTSPESPIIDSYPVEFEQDLNGKQQDWEAVVLIPFMEEERLLAAMQPLYPRLTAEEAARNSHGPMWSCTYSQDCLGRYEAPDFFPPVERHHCLVTELMREAWELPVARLRKGLMQGVKLGTFFPGFPTLQHINHTARLKKAQVRVFEQTSRGESMILTLGDQGRPDIAEVARAMIGKEVWVGWPHLIEAKVRSVSTVRSLYREPARAADPPHDWNIQAKEIGTRLFNRYGIEIGDTQILVHASPMSGRKYVFGASRERITLEKQWHTGELAYPLQTVVADIDVHDSAGNQYKTIEELFHPGTSCFMLGEPHYGALGSVIKIDPEHKGRIQLRFTVSAEPDFRQLFSQQAQLHEKYETAYRAAQYLGISSHLLSRITGTIFLIRGAREQQMESASRSNIGLNLKFNKRNEEVAGFTKKMEGGWTYSRACVDILREYQARFPDLFDYIAANSGNNNNASNDMFHELDVFEEEVAADKVRELITWLESLPTASASRQPFGTETVSDTLIAAIEKLTEAGQTKEVVMQVRPHLLYLPNQFAGSSLVDPNTTFYLFDRVVNVREGFSVPLGLRGTLVRIQKGAKPADNLYDVIFDAPFNGGLTLRCSPGRGYRLPGSALINISYKEKTQWIPEHQRQEKPRAVVRPYDSHQQQQENVWHRDQQGGGRGRGVRAGPPPPQPPSAQSLPLPPSHMQATRFEQSEVRILQRVASAGRDVGVGTGRGFGRGANNGGGRGGYYQQQQHIGHVIYQQNQAQMEQMWMMMQSGQGQQQQQQVRGRREDQPQQQQGRSWRENELQQQQGRSWREDQPQQQQGRSWREIEPQQHQQPPSRGKRDHTLIVKSVSSSAVSVFDVGDPIEPAYMKRAAGQAVPPPPSANQQPGRAALAGPSKGRGRGRRSAEPQQHSVEEMEQSLKKLLNIANSSGGPAPAAFNPLLDPPEERPASEKREARTPQKREPPTVVGRGSGTALPLQEEEAEAAVATGGRRQESYQQKLRRLLYARGAQVPRYDTIVDPATGRIEAQVSLDSGNTYTSDDFHVSAEAAYESAAKNAVLALKTSSRPDKVVGLAGGTSFVPLQVAQRAVKSKERSQSQETEEKELLGAKSREVRQPVVEAVVASSSSAAVSMPGGYPRGGQQEPATTTTTTNSQQKRKKKVKLAANFAALGGQQ